MKIFYTIGLLVISNIFMTFAWYGHLKLQDLKIITSNTPLYIVILLSWGIALLEYCFLVPANRIGYIGNNGPLNLMQLKVLQETVTLTVFTIIVVLFFHNETLHWNHFVAFICLILAVFFAFLRQSEAFFLFPSLSSIKASAVR